MLPKNLQKMRDAMAEERFPHPSLHSNTEDGHKLITNIWNDGFSEGARAVLDQLQLLVGAAENATIYLNIEYLRRSSTNHPQVELFDTIQKINKWGEK